MLQRLEELSNEHKSLNRCKDRDRIKSLRSEAANIIINIIKENKYFSNIKWTLEYDNDCESSFYYELISEELVKSDFLDLYNKFSTYFHFNDIYLYSNDGRIYLSFDENCDILDFIKEYDIKYTISKKTKKILKIRYKEIKKQLKTIEHFLED